MLGNTGELSLLMPGKLLPKNVTIASTPIIPLRASGWEQMGETGRKVLRSLDFLGVDVYNVSKKTSVHCEFRTSGLSRYIGLPRPSGRGTRESIIHSSAAQLLKDPPLVRAALVRCDSHLIR